MRWRGSGHWSIWLLAAMAMAMGETVGGAGTVECCRHRDRRGWRAPHENFSDPNGQVMRERIAAAKATLDPKVTAFSKLRKISLNRLEQAIVDHQGTLSDEMRYLAGLQRVRYVFYYPDSKDIVLAGPAEGWAPMCRAASWGLPTARPVVQLQDVVVGRCERSRPTPAPLP